MTQKCLKLARIYCFSLHYAQYVSLDILLIWYKYYCDCVPKTLQSFAGGDDDRQLLPMSNSIIEFEVADKERVVAVADSNY